MKRISIQLGFYFLIVTLLIESVLFVSLYYSLVNNRVNEEMTALKAEIVTEMSLKSILISKQSLMLH